MTRPERPPAIDLAQQGSDIGLKQDCNTMSDLFALLRSLK
jgi:hypothetical protein